MNKLKYLLLKELYHLFNAPTAYIFTAIFLAINNFFYFNNLFLMDQATLRPYFTNFPLTLIFFTALLTMDSFAAERKSGTLEVLLSLPVNKTTIVLAKYLAVMIFFLFVLIFTLPNLFILTLLGQPDIGPIVTSYLGTIFLVSLYVALGIFVSVLSKEQLICLLVTVFFLFIWFFIGEDFILQRVPSLFQTIFNLICPSSHFLNFVKGIIYPKDMIYFLSTSGFFIFLTIKNLKFLKS